MKPEKKFNKWLVILALCSVALATNANSVNNPCLPQIYESFPNASEFLRNYIVNGQMIVALPFILLVGRIADCVNKKLIILIGTAIYLVGGVGGAFASSIEMYAVCRSLVGIGMGIESSVVFGILFSCFTDPDEAAQVMGYYQGTARMVGTIFPILAGTVCAAVSWRSAAWLNAIAVVTFLCILIFLPSSAVEPTKKKGETAQQQSTDDKKLDLGRVIFTLAECMVFIIFGWLFYYFNSLYIAERSLGSSVLAGGLGSIFTVGGVLINLVLKPVHKKLGRYCGVVSALGLGVMFLLLGLDVPVWGVLVLAVCNGVFCGLISSFYGMAVNSYVPASQTSFFQSIYSCCTFAAYTLVSYIPSFFMNSLGADGYQQVMRMGGITMLAFGAVILIVLKTVVAKKPAANH